jgi:predicted Rossmann fold flavoprotein
VNVRVVGTGPAGLAAAEVLGAAGIPVTLIDHHQSPSRKFLLAGRGGLNLTHAESLEKFLMRYGDGGTHLNPIIRAFPPDALRTWCHELGIETFVGSSGRVFPKQLKASPLLRSWLRRLESYGVKLQLRSAWQGFDDTPTILALGGASWPELGSDGAWRSIFEKAGIAVSPFRASNVRQPVQWSEVFAAKFSGQPIKNVSVTCGKETARGEIMISRDGIEGGAVYALSHALKSSRSIGINLKPDLSAEQITQRLARPRGKDSRSNFLRKTFNLTPAAIALMREAKTDDPSNVRLELGAEPDLCRAISTAGGVAWTEVNADLSLKKYPNTYVTGEMLDWDAPTGGYLLQASIASGRWAAAALAGKLSL